MRLPALAQEMKGYTHDFQIISGHLVFLRGRPAHWELPVVVVPLRNLASLETPELGDSIITSYSFDDELVSPRSAIKPALQNLS